MLTLGQHLYAISLFNAVGLVRRVLIDPDTLEDPDDPYAEFARVFPDFFDPGFHLCKISTNLNNHITFRVGEQVVQIEGPFENYGVIRIQKMVERFLEAHRA